MSFARLMQPLGPLAAGLLLEAVSGRTTVLAFGAVSAALAVCGTAARGLRV
jgi:hypothetical protein